MPSRSCSRHVRSRSHVVSALSVVLGLAGLLAAPAAPARGDEIVTRSGTRYEGKIQSEDATHWVIDTPELGILRLPKSDVASVRKGDAAAPAAAPGSGSAKQPGSAPGAPRTFTPEELAAAALIADAEEAKKKDEEARDAAVRVARRKATTIRRRIDVDPASGAAPTAAPAPTGQAPATPTEEDPQRGKSRQSFGGADLASVAPGSQVVVFEPTRAWPAAPSALLLGRRTWARFAVGGTASATVVLDVEKKPERLTLRFADVQRHIPVQTEAARERLFEGIDGGDWIRVRLHDGTTQEGRLLDLLPTAARLRVPREDASPGDATVPYANVVQVDGLLHAAAVDRALEDAEAGDPIGLIYWPDAREQTGRFVDRTDDHVRLDTDGDGHADAVVPRIAPIAAVRRIPNEWREKCRSALPGTVVRIRSAEDYPDARVERVYMAPVASVTAYAVSVKLEDGCAIVPFESLVSWETTASTHAEFSTRRFEPASMNLPILPGATASAARAAEMPQGVSFVTDGSAVTHVFVAPPYARDVLGLRLGADAAQALGECELTFGTEVIPKVAEGAAATRELISESVDGIRVTAYVNAGRQVSALEITRR